MPERLSGPAKRRSAEGPEFDLTRAWADSRHDPAHVYQGWRTLYRAHGVARRSFPDVDWISLIAVLNVIAIARAHSRRVDISYLAAEMAWPRTTALRRLRKYGGSGYLTLTREGRHTYVDNTQEARRAALEMVDVVIDSIADGLAPLPVNARQKIMGPSCARLPGPASSARTS